jgi:molybdopterin converting factor small subunit
MATIIIPTPLRKYTDQNRSFESDRDNLSAAIRQLVDTYPDLEQNLLDENQDLRSYIKIYIGEDEIDPAENGTYALDQDTEVSIVPAIAGGC